MFNVLGTCVRGVQMHVCRALAWPMQYLARSFPDALAIWKRKISEGDGS
jgi:hypothetical protein